jgi:hypothetical protein
MHTGGPGDDGRDPPREGERPNWTPAGLPQRSAGGGRPPRIVEPPAPGDMREEIARNRDAGRKAINILLIIVVGIPVGLLVFGALLFGVCLLAVR